MCAFFGTLIIRELHFKVHTSLEAQNFMLFLSLSLHSSSPTFKLLSMASYGGELLLDSSSPWIGAPIIFLLHSVAIHLQEAKDSIDEEDPRPTSSTWSYIRTSCLLLKQEVHDMWNELLFARKDMLCPGVGSPPSEVVHAELHHLVGVQNGPSDRGRTRIK